MLQQQIISLTFLMFLVGGTVPLIVLDPLFLFLHSSLFIVGLFETLLDLGHGLLVVGLISQQVQVSFTLLQTFSSTVSMMLNRCCSIQSDREALALESALAQLWENSGSPAADTAGVMLICSLAGIQPDLSLAFLIFDRFLWALSLIRICQR